MPRLCVPWFVDSLTREEDRVELLPTPVWSVQPPLPAVAHGELMLAKDSVGIAKVRHGEARWKAAVAAADVPVALGGVMDTPASRAYFKLIEILRTMAIPCPRTSLHLCEAPGGFAQAVATEFPECKELFIMSRRTNGAPYFASNVLHNPRICAPTLDANSDITLQPVREQLLREVGAKVELITADGGIDNDAQPELTEQTSAFLIACEIDTALRAQKVGGTFVLKVFGLQQAITEELVALLASYYKTVAILKPFTSHSVNDERYVVCQGFAGAAPRLPLDMPGALDLRGGAYLAHACALTKPQHDAWRQSLRQITEQMAKAQEQSLAIALQLVDNPSVGERTRSQKPRHQGRPPYPARGRASQMRGRGGRLARGRGRVVA